MTNLELQNVLEGRTVLVTGAGGSLGRLIADFLMGYPLARLRLLDQREHGVYQLMRRYGDRTHVRFFLGDVRSRSRMRQSMRGADMVIHTASLKHVELGEYNPGEVVQTNLVGLQAVIQAALDNGISHLVYTSSDKAVNPTNVMGASKLLGERLVVAAWEMNPDRSFNAVRLGNVLGSAGSVVPLFIEQIRQGGPVTVTDHGMTRFVMTPAQAVRIIVESCVGASGGRIVVPKMSAVCIADLAALMIEQLAPRFGYLPDEIDRTVIGPKPGEKLFEESMTAEESRRAQEMDDHYVIQPLKQIPGHHGGRPLETACSSRISQAIYRSDQAARLNNEKMRDLLSGIMEAGSHQHC